MEWILPNVLPWRCDGGIAGKFLKAATSLMMKPVKWLKIKREIQICMFASGAKTLKELDMTRIIEIKGEQ
jgi:isopentenyl diphosphate isomerase/L-lactate dehydrogenase-like FMN-dependent dehydrogenase